MSDLFCLYLDFVDFLQVVFLVLGNLCNETLFESVVLALVKVFDFIGVDCI